MRYVIPLTPEPQRFSIVLAGRELLLAVRWMDAPEGGWLLDMADAEGVPLVSGIPLVAGCDLLEPYVINDEITRGQRRDNPRHSVTKCDGDVKSYCKI